MTKLSKLNRSVNDLAIYKAGGMKGSNVLGNPNLNKQESLYM